jgi:crossover junction endodeoxyribonuclease RusA
MRNMVSGSPVTKKSKAESMASSGGRSPVTIEMTLPYPPSVNHYWRCARGKFYISAEGQNYRRAVQAHVVIGNLVHGEKNLPMLGPLEMWLQVEPPDQRERDLDNVNKALWDALQKAGVYAKDYQISKYHVERLPAGTGKVYVRLAEIAPEAKP